jgi:hypothetical protein
MKNAPFGWAMLMYDLEDAQQDLGSLLTEMQNDPGFDEESFRTRLGHIYWHLNRAWHRRNVADELSEDEEAKAGQFPNDLQPV